MSQHVIRAARFMREHAAEPIGLADVADEVGYSRFHLVRLFHSVMGITPGQYLAAVRFDAAKRLLLAGDDKVIDVCMAVGFSSPGTFTRRFALDVGMTPREFRALPHLLAAAPPRPVLMPGPTAAGGTIHGTLALTPGASAALGSAEVYVGAYTEPSPRGVPVAGVMVPAPGEYVLRDLPDGPTWVLAAAVPAGGDPLAQLLPAQRVTAVAGSPTDVAAGRTASCDLVLDLTPDWRIPVTVALPAMASAAVPNPRVVPLLDLV